MIRTKNVAAEANRKIGADNRDRIRQFFRDHVGATRRECAEALDLNECIVGRHVKIIRLEWQTTRRRGKK